MELVGNFISTIGELNEILATTDKLVLLYFYSEWSPSCRRIRFEFMQAMSKYPDAEYIAANIDNCKALSKKLRISLDDIPALVVFKEGKILKTLKRITASRFNAMDYIEPPPGPML
ncbi:hypothetical protein BsWGS_21295 [Bradybaena similaris]